MITPMMDEGGFFSHPSRHVGGGRADCWWLNRFTNGR